MRRLTPGEIALAETVFPDPLPWGRIGLQAGPGRNPVAALAFRAGNIAIALRRSIYFAERYSEDFAAAGTGGKELFLHELTHVWQFARAGVPLFLARYGLDLLSVGLRPRRAYQYRAGDAFARARLEAQAEMVGHYHRARAEENAPLVRLLEGNMQGTGFYGL